MVTIVTVTKAAHTLYSVPAIPLWGVVSLKICKNSFKICKMYSGGQLSFGGLEYFAYLCKLN